MVEFSPEQKNHLGSPVHQQAITHGAEASARKKKGGGQ